MVHLYIGNGKGKTTAALGLALRAAGFGKKVYVAQFLKGADIPSGLVNAVRCCRLPLEIERFSDQIHPLFLQGRLPVRKSAIRESTRKALDKVERFIGKKSYDVIVLDEILNSVDAGFCTEARLRKLCGRAGEMELVLTGRKASPALIGKADYVSLITKKKHPFDRGVFAREGIEY